MTRTRPLLAVALLLLSPALAAAVPNTVAFSARIADQGRPVTGTQTFTFTLWTLAEGGDPAVDVLWTETKDLTVSDGVATTALGDVDPVANGFPAMSGAQLFLEVTMGTQTFSPRIAFHSVPYALRAAVVDTAPAVAAGGVASGSFTTTSTVLATTVATFPAPGYAIVTGMASFNNSTASNFLGCQLRRDGSSFSGFWFDGVDVDGWYDQQQSRTGVVAVGAGPATFTLTCNSSGGSVSWTDGQVIVVYVPNAL